jgi:hypothetical protein
MLPLSHFTSPLLLEMSVSWFPIVGGRHETKHWVKVERRPGGRLRHAQSPGPEIRAATHACKNSSRPGRSGRPKPVSAPTSTEQNRTLLYISSGNLGSGAFWQKSHHQTIANHGWPLPHRAVGCHELSCNSTPRAAVPLEYACWLCSAKPAAPLLGGPWAAPIAKSSRSLMSRNNSTLTPASPVRP